MGLCRQASCFLKAMDDEIPNPGLLDVSNLGTRYLASEPCPRTEASIGASARIYMASVIRIL